MDRINKWVYLATGLIIGILIILIAVMYPGEVGIVFLSNPDIISTILVLATSGVCFLTIARLLPIYWNKEKEPLVAEILIGIFLFLGLTLLVQVIFSNINLRPPKLNLVFTQSELFFVAVIGLLLARFQIEVFGGGLPEKHNRSWFVIVVVMAACLDVIIIKDTLVSSEDWEQIIFGAPGVFTLFYLLVRLAYSSLVTVKKINDPAVKKGFRFMGFGWVVLTFGFVFMVVGGFFSIERSVDPGVYIVLSAITFGVVFTGTSLLYLGFTRPMKKKRNP